MRFLKTMAAAAVSIAAVAAHGALRVVEKDGSFSILRDGATVVESIRVDRGDVPDDDVKSTFAVTKDATRAWNRWSEEKGRRFRLEVVERRDGAVEITMAGQVDWNSPFKRRRIAVGVPAGAFDGKRWESVTGGMRHYEEERGEFGNGDGQLKTRFLAVDGMTFDFNPLGAGDNLAGSNGGWRHADAIRGVWSVHRSDGSWILEAAGDVLTSWGGYVGAKLVLREGSFADFGRFHALREFSYEISFAPVRLVSFGSPRHGDEYCDGDVQYGDGKGFGWVDVGRGDRKAVVGNPSGAYYSSVTGAVASTYRFGPLPDGYYFFTFAAGNRKGGTGRFGVALNGQDVLADANVPSGSVRQVTRAVRVEGGTADVSLSGDWMVSVMALQPILNYGEDFSFARGVWASDGFEPGMLHRNCDVAEPPVFAVRDEVIPLPDPGSEFAAQRRNPPAEVELPPPGTRSLLWTYNASIFRLFNNSSTLSELDAPGDIDAYLDRELAGRRVDAIMLSGMLSRHTYVGHLERGLDAVRRITEAAHKRGLKVIDHWDATLVWNVGEGFRVMAERTPELVISTSGRVPSYQLCIMNPDFRKRLFEYAARDVANGVDGLQIDEVIFWRHGCVCRHCREAFHGDTGWTMPMDETDPAWTPGSPFMKQWKNWRIRKSTDFLLELRRSLKKTKPDLILSAYTTPHGMFSSFDSLCNGRDIMDLARTVNFFGIEVMTRSVMKSARAELPCHRTTCALTCAHGAPAWNWYYNADWQNDYVAWALSEMTGQTPLLAEVDRGKETPDYPGFKAGMFKYEAKQVAEVALLFSAASRNWNEGVMPKGDLLGTAQALEALHVPYQVISDVSLEKGSLDGFKVLFVGASHCLSDRQVAAVRAFAENGGTVRLSTLAGACDEMGDRRAAWPFRDVFGFEPKIDTNSVELIERQFGKGRFIYSPAPRGAAFEMRSITDGHPCWYDPDPREESRFRKEVAGWTASARWWDVVAPDQVYTSVWRERDGTLAIHFLNLTGVRNKPWETVTAAAPSPAFPPLEDDITFTVRAPSDSRAIATSPEFAGGRPLKVVPADGGKVVVTIPKELFRAYVLVRLYSGGDSAAINRLVEAACAPGGSRRVVLPNRNPASVDGAYHIGATIFLPSDFTLVLDGSRLVMEPDAFCNMFANRRAYTPAGRSSAGTDRNISIEGRNGAVLDGGFYNGLNEAKGGKDGWPPIWVNNLILFANVEGFRISGLSLRNQRWWAMNFIFCSEGTIRDVDFLADCTWFDSGGILHRGLSRKHHAIPRIRNADGIDIRMGCHDISIENVAGFTEDDTVAITGIDWALERRFAVEGMDRSIKRISVRNVKGASYCSQVRVLSQDGVCVRDVRIDGVEDISGKMDCLDRGGCGVRIGDMHVYGGGARRAKEGDVCDVAVKNVRSRAATAAVLVVGRIPGLVTENIEAFDGCPADLSRVDD